MTQHQAPFDTQAYQNYVDLTKTQKHPKWSLTGAQNGTKMAPKWSQNSDKKLKRSQDGQVWHQKAQNELTMTQKRFQN